MDAQRIANAKGNVEHKVTDAQAVRMTLAAALRELADEIEYNNRILGQIQTFEQVDGNCATSILHLVTHTARKPLVEP